MRPINAFRASQLLRRNFVMPGDDPAQELDDVVKAVFEVEQSVRARPEHAWARGERIFSGFATSAALAAQSSSVGLRNPETSEVFLVVLGLHVRTPALLLLRLNADQSLPVVATANAFVLDTRYWTRGDPTGISLAVARTITAQGNVPVPSPFYSVDNQVNGAAQYQEYPPVVLAPGTDLYVTNNAVNAALSVAFWGVEREATRSELGGR